jgi:PPK2 family polyphosphate:nucleotide phosphotransferase
VIRLAKLQDKLYAQANWSVLIVLQAMDAGGKDSTIKHVMSGVNPQGVHVTTFKPPGPEELAHDFLWRISKALPARGMIGIFNRSHYEDVLVPRVYPHLLEPQRLPAAVVGGKHFWEHRLESIAAFERHLARQGTVILKFFLHISREEQKKRFLDRLDDPAKRWKFSLGDLKDREHWDGFMDAYEAAIAATAAKHAPWFTIPADDKPVARLLVVEAINEALESLDLHRPKPTDKQEAELAEARTRLGG